MLEAALRRDRAVVLAGLAAVVTLAWAYLLRAAGDMGAMAGEMTMAPARPWGSADLALTFTMWAVMMVAMMVPSVAPVVLMLVGINRRQRERELPYVPVGVFLLGYLTVWTGFALLATGAQWGLHQASLLPSRMDGAVPALGGLILVAAGVFQWTPLKDACLRQCRTPLGFLIGEWRDDVRGRLVMGLKHGTACLGCCWALMALMFVGGAMKLLWMAGIAAYVLLEKVVPAGHWIGRATGVLLVAWGLLTISL